MKRTIYLFTPTSARMFTDGVAQSGRCINRRVAQLVESVTQAKEHGRRFESCHGND